VARVNVEQAALTDPRYSHLGKLLGTSRHDALGRMVAVWNVCQERETYVLDIDTLNHMFDDVADFVSLLISAKLGREDNGGVYISGTRGRIEWLATKRDTGRQNGKKGGRPVGSGRKPMTNQHRLRTETPPAPAPALPPAPTKEPVQGSELAAGLRALGISVPKSKVAVVGRWAERFGGADRVLALAREHIDRIEGANYPLQYLGGILRKDADGTGPRPAHGGPNAAAQPARKLTQDFPHDDIRNPEFRKKHGLPPLQSGPAGGPDGAVH
jgi:hypothetical protein